MEGTVIEAVAKEIVVNTTQQRAFELFTGRLGAWWPASHHIGAEPFTDALVEPRTGGRWYEVAASGAECNWGRVLAWDPYGRVVLSWNIGPTWQYDADMEKASEVEVRFIPVSGAQTRVELEHRNISRHGEGWENLRAGVDQPGGWMDILNNFNTYVDGAQ